MKIVFLDSLSLGGKNLKRFEKFGEFIEYSTTSPNELQQRIEDADIVITNKVLFGKNELQYGKKLKLICIAATGVNNVDIPAANSLGIKVINVKDYSTESVAQMTMTFILNLSSSLISYNDLSGDWPKSPIFTMLKYPFFDLKGKTLGIIGYGAIGKKVEELAKSFGMKTIISQRPRTEKVETGRVSFETLLKESDFITIHSPLNENTNQLFDIETLSKMKKTSFLINTARGPIVVEEDLAKALKNGIISGAAIDVMQKEPPSHDNPLLNAPNLIITPHIAWASNESLEKLLTGIENNISMFLDNTLISL